METRLKDDPCPECGRMLDAATGIDPDAVPKPGDITICFYCGHLMVFDEQLKHRELNDAEMRDLAGDPLILRMQKARHAIWQNRSRE